MVAVGRPCTVCRHPERGEIEAALGRGEPNRRVAARFRLAESSLRRHLAEHAPRTVALADRAVARADLKAGLELTDQMADLQDRTLAILTKAEDATKLGLALLAIREARGNLELLAKLTGKLRPEVKVDVAVLVAHPAFLALKAGLLEWAREDGAAATRIAGLLTAVTESE